MGKLATMIVWGGIKHGIPLLAFMLLVQTGCLYLTTVYADFELDAGRISHRAQQVTGFYGDDDDESTVESELWGLLPDENANTVIIEDFVELSSAKVMMKVKESEDGFSLERIFNGDGESENSVSPEKLKRLEEKFLNLFGMRSRPKRRNGGKRQVPKELIDLYEKQSGLEIPTTDLLLPGKLTRNANTVRVINPFEITSLEDRVGEKLHALLKFDLSPSSIPPNEKITGAELRVPFSINLPSLSVSVLPENTTPSSIYARVLLHDIIKPHHRRRHSPSSLLRNNPSENSPITHVIDSKLVNLTNRKSPSFWLTFDILPAVLRWMTGNGNHTNYGVALQIVGLSGEPYHDIKHSDLFNMHLNPELDSTSLFLYSDDGHNAKHNHLRRNKRDTLGSNPTPQKNSKSAQRKLRRAAHQQYQQQQQYYRNHNQYSHYANGRRRKPHRHKNKRRNLCSKKPMFVDFTDVGWNDWIVAPPGYQAYYCSGECPFPMGEHLNATNHAVIQALINSMNPSLVPPPCCVPNKYSSLSLLYTDSSDRIVLKNYNEMVVDSCGCS